MPILIAHRAGNNYETAKGALGRSDMLELDVHVFRRRVEVRHEKVIWPTSHLWEKWHFVARDAPPPLLSEVLESLEPGTPIQLDLKCFTRSAARRIRASVPPTHPVVVSSRSWWVLEAFDDRPETTMLRSCRSRWQLKLAAMIPGLGPNVGVVAHEEILNRAAGEAIRSKTPVLFSWAVKSPERGRELAELGVTGLIVDDLDLDWRA